MKTLRKVEIIPVFIEKYLPKLEEMQENHVYISKEYNGSSHLCLCGCKQHIFISINHEDYNLGWNLIEKNDKISFTPSLAHYNGCKSHYIITNNVANFV